MVLSAGKADMGGSAREIPCLAEQQTRAFLPRIGNEGLRRGCLQLQSRSAEGARRGRIPTETLQVSAAERGAPAPPCSAATLMSTVQAMPGIACS